MSLVSASREASRDEQLARLSKAERKEAEAASAEQPQGEAAMFKVRSLIGRDAGQEIRLPYHAATNALQSGTAERIAGEIYPPDFPGAPAVMSTEAKVAGETASEDVSGTVAEAQERVAAADTIEALDAIEQAEKDGKSRKGVLDAIATRRAALDVTFGTVGEVRDRIGAVATVQELDNAEARESAGKARKGVLEAIAARREELTAPPKPSEPTE